MISRQYKKREKKKNIQQILLVVFFIILITYLNISNRNPFTRVAHFVSIPILKIENNLSYEVANFTKVFNSKRTLIAENNNLKRQLLETEGLNILNKSLEDENKELRFLLGRDPEENLILASVLSRPNTSIYDTLIVDIGAKDGVHVGDGVVAFGDFSVGFVSKVFTNSSQITLFSSPGEKTNILMGENDVRAVAVGRGAGNFYVELPRDLEVNKGDKIVLANFTSQVFGEVEEIIQTEADAFKTLLFKSPINVFTIGKVQIVRSNFEI